jgi:hypothetical protein
MIDSSFPCERSRECSDSRTRNNATNNPRRMKALGHGTHPKEARRGDVLLRILATFLNAGQGAMAGWASEAQGNPRDGHPGAGAGFEAGFNARPAAQYRPNELDRQRLEMQRTQAETAAIPVHAKQQQSLIDSEIAKNNAAADRKDVFQVAGGGLYERLPDRTVKEIRGA